MAPQVSKPYIRLLRTEDLGRIKEEHRSLFHFDIVVQDDILFDAVSSSRWLCLASVKAPASPQQEEQLAGFVMSAVGTARDFDEGGYLAGTEGAAATEGSMQPQPSSSSSSRQTSMGLHVLKLEPEDVVVNVCLLGVLPSFQRMGIASSLFAQVINSARTARAKAIVLHVLDSNEAARAFYRNLGFIEADTVKNFYAISPQTGSEVVQYKDAKLLYLPLYGPEAAQITAARDADAFLSTGSAYRLPRSRSTAAASSSASPSALASGSPASPSTPPPPKMRGLMGPSSVPRPRARAAAPPPPATPSPSASGWATFSMPVASKAQQAADGASVFGFLGGLLKAVQPEKSGEQGSPAQEVSDAKSSLLVVQGADGEVHLREGGEVEADAPASSTEPVSRDVSMQASCRKQGVPAKLRRTAGSVRRPDAQRCPALSVSMHLPQVALRQPGAKLQTVAYGRMRVLF